MKELTNVLEKSDEAPSNYFTTNLRQSLLEKSHDVSSLYVPTQDSNRTTCSFCLKENIPNYIYEPTALTWLNCGGICLIGCWLGLCLVPILDNDFQYPKIYCSYCNKRLDNN